jgi:hypothetical protein
LAKFGLITLTNCSRKNVSKTVSLLFQPTLLPFGGYAFVEVNRMKVWKLVIAIGLAVIGAALVIASAFAYMGAPGGYNTYGTYPNGVAGGHMGGMMGGNSYGYPAQPNVATPTTPAYPNQYGRGGCHGRYGWNGYATPAYTTNGTTINIDDAVTIAQNYLASLNNPDLAAREIEEYTQNFYVQYYEKSTGVGAFEMLIDKYSGSIYPEMGPNMMWNTKYGMHSGMIGGNPTAPMTVTAEEAENFAQQWLNANLSGTTVGEAEPFYGYYHVMVLSAGEGYGMLSVNGYTGQVWYHNWHGVFIQEIEIS